MYRSSAELRVGAGDLADSIAAAIADEYRPSRQSTTRVSSKDGTVSVDFVPQDIVHLRAALNSTLRLIQASHDSLEATRSE